MKMSGFVNSKSRTDLSEIQISDPIYIYKYFIFSKIGGNIRFERETTLSAARKLVYSPKTPVGVLAYSEQMVIGLMITAKERGLRIP